MAIRDFAVGPLRSLQRAEAHDLGNLVVLAGANGAGKSTLLDLLRLNRTQIAEPGTKVMFIGPHRTWRSSALSKVALYGYPMASYGALLESDNLPQYQFMIPQGMQGLQGTRRESSSAEDAPAFVKTTLGRLRDRQQSLVTSTWEQNRGQVQEGEVPDLFQPFRRMVSTLLPHLDWVGVDDTDPNNVQVRFKPSGQDGPVFDIDQLSSGEKAAIALLLPLVERQSEELVVHDERVPGFVPLTMLLDEPELHLHPLLQLQMLQYLRELASNDEAQFILSTHSPTLLDALNDDELYLISPASVTPENQLARLTSSDERLEVAREITGSTHLLTRSKPIVFVEGEVERPGVHSDIRLISNLLPETNSWALVAGRSKSEVVDAVDRLRQDGLHLPGSPVFGLVDSDTDGSTSDEHVIAWPVAMIENLLLDADAIFEVLAPFGSQTRAGSVDAVRGALRTAASAVVEEEVRIRVQRQIPVGRLSLRPEEIEKASLVAQATAGAWLTRLELLDVAALTTAARAEVDGIIAAGAELERFRGKQILAAVYQDLRVTDAGLGRAAFALLVSATGPAKARALQIAGGAMQRIALYFPNGLASALRSGGDPAVAEDLIVRCEAEFARWNQGRPDRHVRQSLRSELFAFARDQDGAARADLVRLATQIGTA